MAIISRNQKGIIALVQEQKTTVDFVKNPQTGKLFFVCGAIQGYVSPKAQELLRNGEDLSKLLYSECSTDNGINWVPCLHTQDHSNVVASFGSALLK